MLKIILWKPFLIGFFCLLVPSCYAQNSTTIKSSHTFYTEAPTQLPDYLNSSPESLGTVDIPLNSDTKLGDLRLWCGGDFVPKRVGSSEGKVTMFLRAGLISTFNGKEGEELSHKYQYYEHAWQDGSSYPKRMKNYRWLVVDKNTTDKGKAGVKVYAEKLEQADYAQYFEHLKAGEEVYFWMSTAGIQQVYFVEDFVFEKLGEAEKPEYAVWKSKDNFRVTISVHPETSWNAETKRSESRSGVWGANLSPHRQIIRSRDNITNEGKDIYLHTKESKFNFSNYELEVVRRELGEGHKINDNRLEAKDIPNIHYLLRVKRTE